MKVKKHVSQDLVSKLTDMNTRSIYKTLGDMFEESEQQAYHQYAGQYNINYGFEISDSGWKAVAEYTFKESSEHFQEYMNSLGTKDLHYP